MTPFFQSVISVSEQYMACKTNLNPLLPSVPYMARLANIFLFLF